MTLLRRCWPVMVFIWLQAQGWAQCPQYGGAYEGFRIESVTIETPLNVPNWIAAPLLGSANASSASVAAALSVKTGAKFDPHLHTDTLNWLSNHYSTLTYPGERLRLALVTPRFPNCDLTARTVNVVYRVYSTEAAYFASRLMESSNALPDRSLAIGEAAEKSGKMMVVPFGGYDDSRNAFGGVQASWKGESGFINTTEVEAGGSSTSYRAGVLLGGQRDPESGWLSHMEWKTGFRSSEDPANDLLLTKTIGTFQSFAATRASGRHDMMFRFGGALEIGDLQSSGNTETTALYDAPQRVLKTFVGSTWSASRQIWNASYGFQLGKGTDATSVDYTKHLIDVSHQIRLLPREHRVIQIDTHFNAGWILGSSAEIPVVERFYGGNLPADFLENSLWKLPSGPQLRSFPQNQLNTGAAGGAAGGTSFLAVNITAALPAWSFPAMPKVVRNAKPLGDGIHLGLQTAQRASLEDYRARTDHFSAVWRQVNLVVSDLNMVQDQLKALPPDKVDEDLAAEVQDLLEFWVITALSDIANANKVPDSGLAWSMSRKLSLNDVDTHPLAHIIESLTKTIEPGLEKANLTAEAASIRSLARSIDQHKAAIAKELLPIEVLAAVPQAEFTKFDPHLKDVLAVAQRLSDEATPFIGKEAPLGTLAFEANEWSVSIESLASLEGDSDPFDSLYVLNRLAVGIGKLVPSQLESSALAADRLAAQLAAGDPAASKRIEQIATDLRKVNATIGPQVKAVNTPPGIRWARQQNDYFVRALDVAFREMNMAAVSPIVAFDVAHIGPSTPGSPAVRYGIGPGIRFSIVSFQFSVGYSFNPNPRQDEKRGAWFVTMEVADLFR